MLRHTAEVFDERLLDGALGSSFEIATPPQGTNLAWGRYRAAGTWNCGAARRAEIAVFAEGLGRPLPDVLLTLLVGLLQHHNAARGIADSSRGGRYLNKWFKKAAQDVGLEAPDRASKQDGYAAVTLGDPDSAARGVVETLVSTLGDRLPLARAYPDAADRPRTMHRYVCGGCVPPEKFWTPKPVARWRCGACGTWAAPTPARLREPAAATPPPAERTG